MQVTTTDQATAEVSKEKEPLRTLQTFRKGSTLGWTRVSQWKAGVFFGMPVSLLLCACLPFKAELAVEHFAPSLAALTTER